MRLHLIPTIRDISINSDLKPLTKFSSSIRSTEFKDILPWSIPQMITKTILINARIVISYAMKWGTPLWIWWNVNGNCENNMIRISLWRESHCRTNTSVRIKKQVKKSRTLRIIARDPMSRKVNHLSKVVWWFTTEFIRYISSSQSLEWKLKSQKKSTLEDRLIGRTSSKLDQTELKTVHKDEEDDWQRKKK